MTYFQFLAIFIVVPLLALLWIQRKQLTRFQAAALILLSTVAVLYTTLWDNYLVANRIWWYDPSLVTGITLGWVPIEEYIFFILETFLVGLWFIFLWNRVKFGEISGPRTARWVIPAFLVVIWIALAGVLWAGWPPGRYLALELVWALPPIMLQLAYGADLLWKNWKLITLAILSATIYLSTADWIAIRAEIWTISPDYTVGLTFGGILPLEEAVFFFLTATLVVFGLFLVLTPGSQSRFSLAWSRRKQGPTDNDPLSASGKVQPSGNREIARDMEAIK